MLLLSLLNLQPLRLWHTDDRDSCLSGAPSWCLGWNVAPFPPAVLLLQFPHALALLGAWHSRWGSVGLWWGMGTPEPESLCIGDGVAHPPSLLTLWQPLCPPRGKKKVASPWRRPAWRHPAVCWLYGQGSRPAELQASYQPDAPAAAITAFVF